MHFATFWKSVLVAVCCAGLSVFGANTDQIPKNLFSCDGRTSGYYADVSTGCQVYHMCDGLGRQFSYRCPSKTLFQQRMLICDHWYMVNCSKAEEDYSANLLIGQQGRAFVEDLQYRRTPRPDLANPSTSDFNSHHNDLVKTKFVKNLVGAEEDEDSEISTDEPKYFLPSHWSTEFSAQPTTSSPTKRQESNVAVPGLVKQRFYKTSYNSGSRVANSNSQPRGRVLNVNSSNKNGNTVNTGSRTSTVPKSNNEGIRLPNGINFPSSFKATTPVYPKHIDIDLSKFTDFGNPLEEDINDNRQSVNFPSKFKATTPVYPEQVDVDLSKFSGSEEIPPEENDQDNAAVNFPSNFKATTPVYPQHVDVDLSKFSEPVDIPEQRPSTNKTVNFGSNFKATTPVYPQSVEATSPIPEEFGLLPPRSSAERQTNTNQDIGNNGHVNFKSNFQATTPVYPQSVEPTSPDPSDIGLRAPQQIAQSSEFLEPSPDIQPPSFDTTFKRRSDEEDPSVLGNTFNSKQLTEFMLTIKPEQLKDLKQLWHIPDYDFPLDTAFQPSYESDLSSFQAVPKAVKRS